MWRKRLTLIILEWAWPPPKNAEVVPDLIDEAEDKLPEKVFPIVTPPIIISSD